MEARAHSCSKNHYIVDVVDWTSAHRRTWTRHNDAVAHAIDEARAEREAQTQAYILMYVRVDDEAERVDGAAAPVAAPIADPVVEPVVARVVDLTRSDSSECGPVDLAAAS